jgi:RND family efflux transporter MFP subunit
MQSLDDRHWHPPKSLPLLLGGLVVIVASSSAAGWWLANTIQREPVESAAVATTPEAIAVRVSPAIEQTTQADRSAIGSTEAIDTVTVTSRVMGQIQRLSVEEGDRVSQGDILVEIDAKDIQAESNRATAAIAQAQASVTVARSAQIQAIAGKNQAVAARSQAEAQFNQAIANRNQAQAQKRQAQAERERAIAAKREAQAQLSEAEAELADAELHQQRMSLLYSQGAISESQLDTANTRVSVIEARIGQIEAGIDQADRAVAQTEAGIEQADAAIAQAEAGVERARSQVSQADAAIEQAQGAVDQAEASIAQARAGVEQAQASQEQTIANLDYGTVKAPFDGVVTRKHTEVGAMAGPGQPLVTLESTEKLRFSAAIPESFVKQVRQGDNFEVEFDAIDRVVSGQVTQIIPSADPTAHNFTVKIALEYEPDLIPGMFGRIRLSARPSVGEQGAYWSALGVPKAAIVERMGITGVYKVVDDRARFQAIATGSETGDRVEVFSGLERGDRVILQPSTDLKDGTTVTVTNS